MKEKSWTYEDKNTKNLMIRNLIKSGWSGWNTHHSSIFICITNQSCCSQLLPTYKSENLRKFEIFSRHSKNIIVIHAILFGFIQFFLKFYSQWSLNAFYFSIFWYYSYHFHQDIGQQHKRYSPIVEKINLKQFCES